MKKLLFSAEGRIGRGQFWKASVLMTLTVMILAAVVNFAVAGLIPNQTDEAGDYAVNGVAAIPFVLLNLVLFGAAFWSGICLGIKRYHDRDKPGVWLLIMFVPFVGGIWYFVETGFLRGTIGPNRFGPDPVSNAATAAPVAYSAA